MSKKCPKSHFPQIANITQDTFLTILTFLTDNLLMLCNAKNVLGWGERTPSGTLCLALEGGLDEVCYNKANWQYVRHNSVDFLNNCDKS